MKQLIYILLAVLVLTTSCTPHSNQPVSRVVYDTVFTSGVQESFGAYYAEGGLDNQVFAIDLYSKGLRLNNLGKIEGSGTNLYFSDVFLAPTDSVLLSGSYVSDTTGAPFTFLPGVYYEGNFSGAYLLLVEDAKLMNYTLLKDGELTLEVDGGTTTIRFVGHLADGRSYSASYQGVLRQK